MSVSRALGQALLRKGHARGCGKDETEITLRKAPEHGERSPAFKPCPEERFPSGQDACGPFSSQNAPVRGVGSRALLKLSGLVLIPLPVCEAWCWGAGPGRVVWNGERAGLRTPEMLPRGLVTTRTFCLTSSTLPGRS